MPKNKKPYLDQTHQDLFGFSKAINFEKLEDPKTLEAVSKIFEKEEIDDGVTMFSLDSRNLKGGNNDN